ncbi:MAG: hypothetical protein HWE27_14635 [Gammaproteobacteria bacterium]|nr:hypothetical protein [Gammaproteobacteria bacterium]
MTVFKTTLYLSMSLMLLACDNWRGEVKEGGPCDYLTFETIASVTSITEDGVVLIDDTEEYYAELYIFTEIPKLKDTYELTVKRITKGSCTPMHVNTAKKVTQKK